MKNLIKQTLIVLSSLIILFISYGITGLLSKEEQLLPPYACTGFAVYFNEPVYGMNFDYPPDIRVRLRIDETGDMKAFHCGFDYNDNFAMVSGMNSAGMFSSNQILVPRLPGVAYSDRQEEEVYLWELHRNALAYKDSVGPLRDWLATRKVIQSQNISLHVLLADKLGDALIIEPGMKENRLTGIEHDYMVMTNFPVHSVKGYGYQKAEGVGADRFITAHEYILQHRQGFHHEQALELLEQVAMREVDCMTRCSMVFDPVAGEILVALDRDFSRIWLVKLAAMTIETHKGFEKYCKLTFGIEGISFSQLKDCLSN